MTQYGSIGQYLDRITGQDNASDHLKKLLLSRRIPHALLFTGPKGIGKFYSAVQFAKELNSLDCELSVSLKKKINQFEEPYVKVVHALPRGKSESNNDLPTAKLDKNQLEELKEQLGFLKTNPYHDLVLEKAQNIKISSIRDLRKFLSLNYQEISFRIIVLYEAHNMSIDSQNAILKSLEEPPDDVVFILHTSNPDLLLSTIKSRCQEIKFNPIDKESVIKVLVEFFDVERSSAELVSPFSDGSVIKAKRLIDDGLEEFLDDCINILRFSLARRYQTAFSHFSKVTSRWGNEGFFIILDFIVKWFLDVLRSRSNIQPEYFSTQIETIEKFNQRYGNYDLSEIISKLEYLNSLRRRNINLNICISSVIFQIGHIGIG